MRLKEFLKECHDKGVVKLLSIYVLSGWIILQVLSVIQDPLSLPLKTITYFIIALLIGFPVYIYIIWKFQLEPREKNPGRSHNFQRMYFTGLGITAFLSFIIAFLIGANNFVAQNLLVPDLTTTEKIAVLEFGNNTGDSRNEILGKMAADWIVHGINSTQVAEVISPELVTSYASMISDQPPSADKEFIKRYFKPAMIISGNFYREGENLILQSRILNSENDEVVIAFKKQQCDINKPLECIENLKQLILSFLATNQDPDINLQEDPPTFEAYQYLLNAKTLGNNSDKYLELINLAIEADATYFEPKVLRIAHYYNKGDYKTADSLRKAIDETIYNDKRQLNLLTLYKSLLEGNNRKIFTTMMKEYAYAPYELGSNSSAMVIALQFVNKPELVDTIYNQIEKSINDLENCQECRSRIYIKALADIELGNYQEVIKLMQPVVKNSDLEYLQKPLLVAFIRSNNEEELENYFSNKKPGLEPEVLQSLYLMVAREYLLQNNSEKANLYLNRIINTKVAKNPGLMAEAYFLLEEYEQAFSIYREIISEAPENITALGRLAIISSRLGEKDRSQKYLEKLNSIRGNYQYGSIDYQMAIFHKMEDNWDKTYEFLLKSIARGNTYTSDNFQNDPLLLDYKDRPEFNKILTYWH
ncbi:tetratricopeptide repeat protein [Christiangramia sabulilitoris]|uniref:Tetratricopeptide repeat protein 21A/21B fifth ARM repeats domain-containing protein n=1 Tax=Christiangramia sabulilitoris TaxID=2583991 RepID=A0A550I683_9FLAO|nr:hypothetical protein [Christiangramia sabulilitoris]TRO66482.1 hypothetical protein FGM01_00960 [Christiangramia sabulilitoris]